MAMTSPSGGRNPAPIMNVTPLVDVALVVLIIFMMVTPMMTKTFWINLPPKREEKETPSQRPESQAPLVMTVDRAGVIRLNQAVLEKNELSERLPRMLAAADQKVVYFDAHDRAPYGVAAEAMDLARAAGARSIAILTKPVVK